MLRQEATCERWGGRVGPPQALAGAADAHSRPRTTMASQVIAVQHRCSDCGEPARVHVLEGYTNGQPVLRHVCATCVEKVVPAPRARRARRPLGLPVVALLGLAGAVLVVMGLLGDYLVPARHPGFGRHQQLGVLVGTVVLGVGLLTRAGVIALAGLLFAAAALCADWLGLTAGPGVGWKQQFMLGVGILLALASLIVQGVRRARARPCGSPSAPTMDAGARPSQPTRATLEQETP
jgi:hypothetical protein